MRLSIFYVFVVHFVSCLENVYLVFFFKKNFNNLFSLSTSGQALAGLSGFLWSCFELLLLQLLKPVFASSAFESLGTSGTHRAFSVRTWQWLHQKDVLNPQCVFSETSYWSKKGFWAFFPSGQCSSPNSICELRSFSVSARVLHNCGLWSRK